MELSEKIRNIQDFPKKGILFRYITPLLQDASYLKKAIGLLAEPYGNGKIDVVVSAEARGFILGGAVAYELRAGFVPVRKSGKLPYMAKRVSYELEYGEDTLEIHKDALEPDDVVLLHDDLLATGGSAKAALDLIELFDVKSVSANFICELSFLNGKEKIKDHCEVYSLIEF